MSNFLTPRNKLILTAVGLVLGVVALAAALVVPQFTKLSDLGASAEDAKAVEQTAKQLLDRRQAAKRDAVKTDAALLELAAAVPESPDLPSMIIELQDVAHDNDVFLHSVAPGDPVAVVGTTGTYFTIPLRLTIVGTWSNTVDFTQALDDMSREIRVVSTETQVDDSTSDDLALDLPYYNVMTEIQIETYVIPAPSENASGAAAPVPVAPAR